jgi:hypothetical protein
VAIARHGPKEKKLSSGACSPWTDEKKLSSGVCPTWTDEKKFKQWRLLAMDR